MNIDTTFLNRCFNALEFSWEKLQQSDPSSMDYDAYRAACVKEFEIILEQSGKLIGMRLGDYFADSRQGDRLAFKDLLRYAAKHDLIDMEAVERWFKYRDNRNFTAHEYGADFAEKTLKLLPDFIADVRSLIKVIEETNSD